jgi:hypothetical protein
MKPSMALKKQPKDAEQKKEEKEEMDAAGLDKGCMKKSSLDFLLEDISKSKFDYNKDGKLDAHEKDHKEETKTFDKFEDKLKKIQMKKSHIKSIGKGGMVFDFGPLTGNPIADNATALLNAHGDSVQMNNAKYQATEYQKAIESYVEKGDAAYAGETTPFGHIKSELLDKTMDQQVAEEFAKGKLDSNGPAVVNHHNEKQMTVGSEIIKATSETDAALIEMMKAQGMDLSSMSSVGAIDATAGGATKVIAGLE